MKSYGQQETKLDALPYYYYRYGSTVQV